MGFFVKIEHLNALNLDTVMTYDKNLINRYQAVVSELTQLNHTHHAHTALLAVSKTHPISAIKTLAKLGQRDFGENYLQEALPKIEALKDMGLTWHYIGHIQRNKTRDIALYFDWVHTIERAIIAKRLSGQRQDLPPLNVLIQVNIDDETSKSGCQVGELDDWRHTKSRPLGLNDGESGDGKFWGARLFVLDNLCAS